MTYPGPGGYGGPPHIPNNAGYGAPPPAYGAPAPGKGAAFFLNIAVVALGVISFLLGFAPYISGASVGGFAIDTSVNFFATNGLLSISLLLVAAFVAAFGMLPKTEGHEGVVAGLSVVGFLSVVFQLIGLPGEASVGVGLMLVPIVSFIQAALAIAVLLMSAGVIKSRAPAAPYGYHDQGGYGPPSQPMPQQAPGYGPPPTYRTPQNPW